MPPADSPSDRPLLLLVGTGFQSYREYLLRAISSRYRIHLFSLVEPTWEQAYLSGVTVLPSTSDGPAMAAAARDLVATEPVDGVLCWDEERILATSYIAQALGVRNGDPAVVWRLRDKAQTREAVAGSPVVQPRSIAVKTLDQALAAAQTLGYPVVVKPRGLLASIGVVAVDDAAQLTDRFAFARDAQGHVPVVLDSDLPILVEEQVFGDEISVDCVVRDGRVTPLFIARKQVGFPPYAEEIGHLLDGADPLLADPALVKASQDAHDALGFRDGWTHSEWMLTATGPVLIEVNGRLGGDMIPYLGLLATGIDPGLVAAAAACGRDVELTPSRRRVSGIRFFYAERDEMHLESVGFDRDALSPAIDRAEALAQPGSIVSPPPKGSAYDRVAFAVAVADSADACMDALDSAAAALHVVAAP